ncbi:MAG: DbpA RNA binding domain-containing protein [Spirochaetia bacterium]|nr:DbpA RNA binding domain-containing protein [Spirochaetia bacterium]
MFYNLCNDFGFSPLTILQQKIPEFAGYNAYTDCIIESSDKDGRVFAGALLHLLRAQKKNRTKSRSSAYAGPEMLLIADWKAIRLLENSNISDSASSGKYPSISTIGTQETAGEDLQKLHNEPRLLAATPERLIDHLRRDNISLRKVADLIIIRPDITTSCPDMQEEDFSGTLLSFNRDLQYIFSKFAKKPKICIFSPNPEQDTSLMEFMRKPYILSRTEWSCQIQTIQTGTFPVLHPEIISEIVFSRQLSGHILVFCDTLSVKIAVQREIDKNSLYFTGSALLLTETLPETTESDTVSGTVFFYGLRENKGVQQIIPIITNNPHRQYFMCLPLSNKQTICRLLEEHFIMENSLNKKTATELITEGKIKLLLEKIRSDKKPEELQEFRKLIRKTVPFSMRRYFAAYLLRDAIGRKPGTGNKVSSTAKRNGAPKPKLKPAGAPAADADGSSLFISIGKSRRVYPKDLSRLLQETAELDNSDILSIKILDNYSFITVSEKSAAQAIAKLNGIQFRGRPITCDYARKRG